MDTMLLIYEKEELTNKKLTSQMNKIVNALNSTVKSVETVARALSEIKKNDLWVDDFKTFEKCISCFGIKKAQAYRIINAVELKDGNEYLTNYSISQISELVRLTNDEIIELFLNDKISETMTCKEIRAIADSVIKSRDNELADITEGSEVPEEEELGTSEEPEINDSVTIIFNIKGVENEIEIPIKKVALLEKWLRKEKLI